MLSSFFKGLLTFLFAFSLGASYGQDKPPADSELQQKIQDHMDVIVDESAGIVDDIMDEARKDERVRDAEEFVEDWKEIADNTKEDIRAHFDEEEESETEEEAADVVKKSNKAKKGSKSKRAAASSSEEAEGETETAGTVDSEADETELTESTED